MGPNLVVNPEFDLGNTGFTSDYLYNPGYICEFGQYTVSHTVVHDPNVVCYSAPGFDLRSIWVASDRNEPGVGNFMLIDPSEATGASDDVWRQVIPVCAGANYTFSVFAKNLYVRGAPNYSGVDPEFEMEINGTPVFGYFVDGILQPNSSFDLLRQRRRDSTVWIQISGTWNAGPDTMAEIVIRNLITGAFGNDLAIDGVFFGICGQDVGIVSTGPLSQCPDSGLTSVTFAPSNPTVSSGWLYYEWYKGDTLLQGDPTPTPITIQPVPGNFFGEYRLRTYNDPFGSAGSGCGQSSISISVSNSCAVSFPVEFAGFDASQVGRYIQLDWQTAREQQNKGFLIEYARGSGQFAPLSFVQGAGNSDRLTSYSQLTGPWTEGLYTFRLRQEDYDGKTSYSQKVQVYLHPDQMYRVQLYPNPAQRQATIEVEVVEDQPVRGEVYSAMGQRVAVLEQKTVTSGGRAVWQLNTQQLPAGVYYVRVNGAFFSTHLSVQVDHP
ncbi:MAG: hypothetical protein OHK0039_42670 [Bacteroidia bacterium]